MIQQLERFLEESPYAANYGTQLLSGEPDVECITPWADHFTGNPLLQAWHGGVVTGVLELTGALQALKLTGDELCPLLSANINFLRPTRGNLDVHTRACFVRNGKQILTIDVVAWQSSPEEPTAGASLTFAREP
ncbi:MAG: PaaI family thioesterase [Pseudomonadota bacterium]|jgi:acyl-coenzyme A thioesterase PaaI-like protein